VLPLRLIGIMANETLLAVPFFTLMGLILERSGMAEDLLDTIGQVFGPMRGGLALAVIWSAPCWRPPPAWWRPR
jgi:TRAP-type mannitol/chloroaromatic compound transport system permease large subunit